MMVPIQIASQRSGLSPHVIRMWERRYGALVPSRTGSNRRLYSEEEIDRLKLLRKLTENGHRISQIATLGRDQLLHLERQDHEHSEAAFQVDAGRLDSPADYVSACHSAATEFESERLRRLLQRARLQFGQRATLRLVVTPLIYELGHGWQEGAVRTGQEHLATAVIREFLMTPVPGSQTATHAPEIVITTPSGEVHELGALLATASARDLGWRTTYLGPNLPAEEIAACARARKATAVALSLVYPEGAPDVAGQLRELRRLLPQSISLIVGGRAVDTYRTTLADLTIHWISDLGEFDALLLALSRKAAPQQAS